MNLTWVMGTRNDGYGGGDPMRRMLLTVGSIRAMRPDDEIIVTEWCPPSGRPRVSSFLGGLNVRVVEVPSVVQGMLDADNTENKPLPFYEYLAKHAAIMCAKNERIIAVNPDNIFLPDRFNGETIDRGLSVRALRYGVDKSWESVPLDKILASETIPKLPIKGAHPNAAGDYHGFHIDDYKKVGGACLKHINWHTDNHLLGKMRNADIRIMNGYNHFHINHEFSCVEAPGRPTAWEKTKPISKNVLIAVMKIIGEANGQH